MKPLHLNLASRPYRDYKPVYAVVVLASLLIAFLMLNNIDTYYRYVRETRSTRARIASLDAQAQQEERRAQQADAQVKTINVSMLDKETRFVNARLAERAFSWSELLDRLERVVPQDVRIRSINPSFTDSGLVHLELSCEAKQADGMIETIIRFTDSEHFSNPFPRQEARHDDGGYSFNLAVEYKPSVARVVSQ